MDINDRIKQVRKDQGLTQTEFASRLFMAMDSISQIERHISNPAPRTIDQICREFNVNRGWLTTGEGEMYDQPSEEETALFEALSAKTTASSKSLKTVIKWFLTLDDESLEILDRLIEEELKKK